MKKISARKEVLTGKVGSSELRAGFPSLYVMAVDRYLRSCHRDGQNVLDKACPELKEKRECRHRGCGLETLRSMLLIQ